jgi:DNA repair photolyase
MFPTAHDITPDHLAECIYFLGNILKPGNSVLVVSKPHLECISALCNQFPNYKQQILFRFTIGSIDSSVLKFWEPNAPSFEERLASLKHAFDRGYKTSISCEPMLDGNIDELVSKVSPYVTDSIWLGTMNYPGTRLAINGANDPVTIATMRQLTSLQSDGWIRELYSRHKDDGKIKWKDNIKTVVGLEIPTEKGLDV